MLHVAEIDVCVSERCTNCGFWIESSLILVGLDCPKNGIICDSAMAEKRLENRKVRYSAAYPTGRERFKILLRR